jgi:hypothetical protein
MKWPRPISTEKNRDVFDGGCVGASELISPSDEGIPKGVNIVAAAPPAIPSHVEGASV